MILKKELPPGQFYMDTYLSSFHKKELSEEQKISELIDFYLKILPEGTTLVSAEKRAISSLTTPYEVIFHHPLLLSIESVELQHICHYEKVENEVKQVELLTRIVYTTRSGKKL